MIGNFRKTIWALHAALLLLAVASCGPGGSPPSLSLSVPLFSSTQLLAATEGVSYSALLETQVHGPGDYEWTLLSGTLPPGLSVNAGPHRAFPLNPTVPNSPVTFASRGALSGTPTKAGTYNFTLKVSAGANRALARAYTVFVAPPGPPLNILTTPLPDAIESQYYTFLLLAVNGTGTGFQWDVASGSSLPSWLTLDAASGLLSGTPTAAGAESFTVQVTDSGGATATRALTLTILPPTAGVTITTPSLPTFTEGVKDNLTLAASGGTPPYTWSIAINSPPLPAGLTLTASGSSAGKLGGTPTVSGSWNIIVEVRDSGGQTSTRSYVLTVQAAGAPPPLRVATAQLPGVTVGQAYNEALTSSGGTGTGLTWALINGTTLPPGLSLSAAGVITGTPTTGGIFPFTVEVRDSAGAVNSASLSVTVFPATAPLYILNNAVLPEGISGAAYTDPVHTTTGLILYAGGGTGGYTWSVAAGSSLPAGMTLGVWQFGPTSGELGGTPTVDGTFTFSLELTDSSGASITKAFTLTIHPPGAAITTTSPIFPGIEGITYPPDQTGTFPYLGFKSSPESSNWSVVSGTLPPGLSLTNQGRLSGTPTTAGTYQFRLKAGSAEKDFEVTIYPASNLAITTPDTIPVKAVVSYPYRYELNATGGTLPYTWSMIPRSTNTPSLLLDGLSMNSDGVIFGTPTDTQSSSSVAGFTTLLLDSAGNAAVKWFKRIDSFPRPLEIWWTTSPSPTLLTATQGHLYSEWLSYITLTIPGGIGYGQPVSARGFVFDRSTTWSLINGTTLPDGMELTPQGNLRGFPRENGNFNFTVKLEYQTLTAVQDLTLNVQFNPDALEITTSAALTEATAGRFFRTALHARGGTGRGIDGQYSWSVAGGSLPAGLSLSSRGVISGTPAAAGDSSFTIRITDHAGTTVTKAMTLKVAATSPAPSTRNPHFFDFNGDGIEDLVVGAPHTEELLVVQGIVTTIDPEGIGQAYVFFGPLAQGATVSAADANVIIRSTLIGDEFGISAAGIGDFNGDGVDDLAVGASRDGRRQGLEAGGVYIFLGRAGPATQQYTLDLVDAEFHLQGDFSDDEFGASIAGIGDFNGDGLDDVLVGARKFDVIGLLSANGSIAWDAGASYIFLGRAAAVSAAQTSISAPNADVIIEAQFDGEDFGVTVAGIGDFNGDGYADAAIAVLEIEPYPFYNRVRGHYYEEQIDNIGPNRLRGQGRVLVYYGQALTDKVTLKFNDADVEYHGENNDWMFGGAISGRGDFNGDGFPDIVVGAPQNSDNGSATGAAYIFYGQPAFMPVAAIGSSAADVIFTGDLSLDEFGASVRFLDFDNDGIDDLAVGARGNKRFGVLFGAADKAYLYRGSAAAPATIPPTSADLIATGGAGSSFGNTISSGDFNNDGVQDLVIGAGLASPNGKHRSGAVYVINGGAALPATMNASAADTLLHGENERDRFGFRVNGGVGGECSLATRGNIRPWPLIAALAALFLAVRPRRRARR